MLYVIWLCIIRNFARTKRKKKKTGSKFNFEVLYVRVENLIVRIRAHVSTFISCIEFFPSPETLEFEGELLARARAHSHVRESVSSSFRWNAFGENYIETLSRACRRARKISRVSFQFFQIPVQVSPFVSVENGERLFDCCNYSLGISTAILYLFVIVLFIVEQRFRDAMDR